jgi:hypothetical protein
MVEGDDFDSSGSCDKGKLDIFALLDDAAFAFGAAVGGGDDVLGGGDNDFGLTVLETKDKVAWERSSSCAWSLSPKNKSPPYLSAGVL